METLTKKQELAVEFVIQGSDKTNAVFKAFRCKNKSSASSIATKLFKQKKVQDRLTDKQDKQDEIIAQKNVDFVDQVKKTIPSQLVINKLKEHLNSKDGRISDSALDKYIKIIGGYKDSKGKIIGLFEKLEDLE